MTILVLILLIAYALGVLSLPYHIWQTARLVSKDAGVQIIDRVPTDLPSLDVIVPVKDEERTIGECLERVLEQDYPNLRLLVVNDRSSDGTAAAIQEIQNRHPNIERLDIMHLPEGAYGKPNAIDMLSPKFSADILFFIDSDMLVKPRCLASVIDYMQKNRLDWFAAYGEPELTYFWERLLAPIFGAMAYSWYDPRKISDPKWPDAIGSGFMAARREAYFATGGHGAVKTQYDEDSAMFRRAKSLGHRLEFMISPNLYTVRLYGTLSRTIRGFHRTMIGGLKTLTRFFITIHALLFISHLPYLIVAGLWLAGMFGVAVPYASYWLVLAGVHWVLANVLVAIIFRTASVPLHIALLHPIGSAVAIWACVRAAIDMRSGKPITWRGTSYQHTDTTIQGAQH